MSGEADQDAPSSRPMSSRFAGDPGQAWSLRRAVDALADSARAAGRPGAIWLAGIGYPTIGLGLGSGWVSSVIAWEGAMGTNQLADGTQGADQAVAQSLVQGLLLLPVLLVIFRLRVGLARIAPPLIWNRLSETFGRPRLRQAWRAGRGLVWSTCGMSLMLNLMMSGVLMLVVSPVVWLLVSIQRNLGEAAALIGWLALILPGVLVLSTYAILLSILHQLALQSLAHNRRGVSSALVHAWRIAKNDPWVTGRTVAVDLLIDVAAFLMTILAATLFSLVGLGPLAIVVALALYGFVGVTRANYWARAYRAMGGLSPDDQVPGLSEAGLAAPDLEL